MRPSRLAKGLTRCTSESSTNEQILPADYGAADHFAVRSGRRIQISRLWASLSRLAFDGSGLTIALAPEARVCHLTG